MGELRHWHSYGTAKTAFNLFVLVPFASISIDSVVFLLSRLVRNVGRFNATY